MTSTNSVCLSSSEIERQFDLLAMDAKEYAIVLMDLEGRLTSWNVGAERMFGYQSQEIMGRHFPCSTAPMTF